MSETTAPVTPAAPASVAESRGRRRSRRAEISLRTVQIALALFFAVASALPKLIAHPSAVESFNKMGWGSGGMYTIGLLELAGAVGLLIPALASVAAVALSALMVGAFIMQLTAFDGENAATPLILMLPLLLIAVTRRDGTAELIRLTHHRA
ncbi:DoxX family protein [Streptomyces sp. NPDC052051]|uniref:DoxX family protein n=1 Tax=Streptomyces sp. NPDC052051 TaxID=3154649 RepID=UPI00344A3904